MKINPINSGSKIPFLKKKEQPVIIQEGIIKMVPDEKADEKEIVPKLRCIYVEQVRVVRGDEGETNGEEKRLDWWKK